MKKLLRPNQKKCKPTRYVKPRLELLEDRVNPAGQLLPINGQEHVFDDLRHVIYASLGTQIQRYDLVNQQALPAWTIGASLKGLDITPDFQYLVVTDAAVAGTVYKVNLSTGNVDATLRYPVGGVGYDVVMVSNTRGFASFAGEYGNGITQFVEINLTTNTLDVRNDRGIDSGYYYMQRSKDRSQVLISTYFDGFPILYATATDTFSQPDNAKHPIGGYAKYSATNRDGSQFAAMVEDYQLDVFDDHFGGVENKWVWDSDYEGRAKITGIIFDPVLDRAYLGNTQLDKIDVYDTNSWKRLYSMPIGVNIHPYYDIGPFGYGSTSFSGDGKYLVWSANGLRLFQLLDNAVAPAASLKVDSFSERPMQGEQGTIEVSARNSNDEIAINYTGTIHFTSTDPNAILPADYTFTPADQGKKEFPVRFSTVGSFTVTAVQVGTPAMSVTSPAFRVHAGLASLPVMYSYDMVHDTVRNRVYFMSGWSTIDRNWDDNYIIQRYDIDSQTMLSPWTFSLTGSGDMEISQDGKYLFVIDANWNLIQTRIRRIEIDTGIETSLWFDSDKPAYQLEALSDGSILIGMQGYVAESQPTFMKITSDGSRIVPAEYQMERPPGDAVSFWIEVSPDRTTFMLRETRYTGPLYQGIPDGYSFHVGEAMAYASQSFYSWQGRFPLGLSNDHVGFLGRYTSTGPYTSKLVDAAFQILEEPWPDSNSTIYAVPDPVRDWFHTYSEVNGVYIDRIINIVDGSIVADLPITTRWFGAPGDYWFGEGQFMVTKDGSRLFVNTNATGNVTIVDLPDFSPTMGSVSGGQGTEGNSGTRTVDFVISLSEAKPNAQEVSYQTMDGTAIAGLDYQALSGSVIFLPGETQKTISVTFLSDNEYELDETVSLKLTQARGEIRIATAVATGTILNDDVPPMVQFVTSTAQRPEGTWSYSIVVQLAQAATLPATVSISLAGTATLHTDYLFPTTTLTFAPGETTKELTIYIDNDLLIEPGETVVATLNNPVNAILGTSTFTYTILDDDRLPGIAFSTSASQGLESTTQVNIPIQLTFPFVYDVVVKYSVIAGTAVTPFDYLMPAGQITFAPGETSKSISLTIVNDSLAEVNETIAIVVEPFMYSERADPWLHVYSILDEDSPPVLSFANATWSGNEGSSVDVVLQLSRPMTQLVSVNVTATGGTAVWGTDYQITFGQLTFLPGETNKTLQLTTIADALYELTESLVLQLSQPINATLGAASFTANITNNDPLPRVGFAQGSSFGSEVSAATVLTLLLSEAAGTPVAVNYQTFGTASPGADYSSLSNSITFTPGETSKTIPVSIVNDSLTEPNETLSVLLTGTLNAQLQGTLQHTYTIYDDETVRTLTLDSSTSSRVEANEVVTIPVRLNSASYQPITVNYAVTGGTASNGLDYSLIAGSLTFHPGETVQFIPLSVHDDALYELAETVIIKLSTPTNATLGSISTITHTISNNDPISVSFDLETSQGAESTTAPAIWVRLAAAATVTTKVSYAVTGGTASTGSDFTLSSGTLSFSPGQRAKKIPITIVNDTRDEDNETVRIQLSNPQGWIALGPITAHTYTIADNDNPPVVSFSTTTSSHTEGNTAVTVTVKLSTASGKPVDVNYTRTSGTATPETDFLFSEGALRFNPGEVSKTFVVNILQDTLDEVDETILLALNTPVNATLGTASTRTITIKDEDAAPKVGFVVASSNITEGAGYVDLIVQLTAASGKQVSVKVGAGTGSTARLNTDYQPFSTTLVFNPGETQKTVRINIVNDAVRESSKLLKVLLSAPVNATLGTITTYQLTIQDDD